MDLHEKLAGAHPKLARGRVWCRSCGATQRVDKPGAMRHGWPKCCGHTMTIDAPDERNTHQQGALAWIRKNYRVPAKRGGRIEYTGCGRSELGTICGASGSHLSVRLDSVKHSMPFHRSF